MSSLCALLLKSIVILKQFLIESLYPPMQVYSYLKSVLIKEYICKIGLDNNYSYLSFFIMIITKQHFATNGWLIQINYCYTYLT